MRVREKSMDFTEWEKERKITNMAVCHHFGALAGVEIAEGLHV